MTGTLPASGDGPRMPFTPNTRYPDPAVQSLHPGFAALRLYSASVEQLASGGRWAEGPQWFADHRCLLWSDIPNNRILRWDDTTGVVTPFRAPSTTPTAWRAILRAGCWPASTARAVSPAPSPTAASPCWPTTTTARG